MASMSDEYVIRNATRNDAREIAKLIEISSDGVASIEWEEEADKTGVSPLDIGEQTYQSDTGDYSWKNCVVVEKDNAVVGMLLTFACPDGPPRNPDERPSSDDNNVLAPYMYLEEPNSWYICGVAMYPDFRGQGIGGKMMDIAHEQAKENGYDKASLIVFKQNTGAVRLYERLGYQTADDSPVVPHPLIRYMGDALLMVRDLQ
ncbi:MAG: GNAT family N-acetyltransferase [Gammaproteobacteria bacterium]|nr:MAG: GNAT family N-acetyltransferase [Gammaproteobacteria bacterium]